MNYPTHIVLHTLAFDGDADVEVVRRWHREQGWHDIGYHYLVRRSGEVQVGREEEQVGAHAIGFNKRSIGIAMEGHGDHAVWTLPQMHSLLKLCDDVMSRYNISPDKVLGHRETGAPKSCPGKMIDMDAFRAILFGFVNEE